MHLELPVFAKDSDDGGNVIPRPAVSNSPNIVPSKSLFKFKLILNGLAFEELEPDEDDVAGNEDDGDDGDDVGDVDDETPGH